MPVRVKIILLFSLLAFIILSLVCTGIYYFSYKSRINTISTRLTNRAITTARLLSQREIFDRNIIRRIDSSTTLSLKDKSVQAYNEEYRRIYRYSDVPNDTIEITQDLISEIREKGNYYFTYANKDAVGHLYQHGDEAIVIFAAGEDVEGKQSLRSLLKILLISFFAGNVLVLISGYIFSGRLLLPIRKISKDVADISAQNLARRIQTGSSRDEWFQLSDTLNELLNRLQHSFELQRRFISNASHELSTPLTSISSQLEVSLQRPRDAGEYKNVMQSIYQDVQHLCKLTQTLLEFAKASGNPGGLDIDLVRIDEVILQLPAEVSKTDPAYLVRISFDNLPEHEENLLVFGNEALLLTAIKNIVVNACKYSYNHEADVLLKVDGTQISIEVRNRGRGIPDEEIANIFQPFYRIQDNRSELGFGLGLSLADRIIKMHKGSISVHSVPAEETIFTIDLPGAPSLGNL
jgi:two-component system sensor histidine kinase ArlS